MQLFMGASPGNNSRAQLDLDERSNSAVNGAVNGNMMGDLPTFY